MTEEKLNELMGTHPAYLKAGDFKSLSASALERVLPMLSAWDLTRVLRWLSASDPARVLRWLSASDLERIIPMLSDLDLAMVLTGLFPSTLAAVLPMLSAPDLERVDRILGGVPALPRPYFAILSAIQSEGCSLDMDWWHSCKTTHCLAGWTVHLAGEAGYALEKKVLSTPAAAALILRKSRPEAPLPNFYVGNEQALAFIKARAAEEEV